MSSFLLLNQSPSSISSPLPPSSTLHPTPPLLFNTDPPKLIIRQIPKHLTSLCRHRSWLFLTSVQLCYYPHIKGSFTCLQMICELVGCKLNSKHTEGNREAFRACSAELQHEKKGWGLRSPEQGRNHTVGLCCLWLLLRHSGGDDCSSAALPADPLMKMSTVCKLSWCAAVWAHMVANVQYGRT